ncbi:MAG: hypothetical protein AB1Z19_00985 [Eubacteriales bacterium]
MEKYITVKRKDLGSYAFEVGKLLCLKKDMYSEEISAWVPGDGKVGTVANVAKDMVGGTYSSARIYDFFAETFYGKIMFTMNEKAVVKLIVEEKKPELQVFDLGAMRQKQG